MPDDPITLATLMQYHREVLLPDLQRVLDKAFGEAVGGLQYEMRAGFDALCRRLDQFGRDDST